MRITYQRFFLKMFYRISYPDRRHGNNLWLWFHYPTPNPTNRAKSGQIYPSFLGVKFNFQLKFSIISGVKFVTNYLNNYFEYFFGSSWKVFSSLLLFSPPFFSGGTLYKSALLLLGSSFSPLAPFRSIAQWRCASKCIRPSTKKSLVMNSDSTRAFIKGI